jgi:hypothetical protein
MGAFGVEPRIEMAADSTAHIVFDDGGAPPAARYGLYPYHL